QLGIYDNKKIIFYSPTWRGSISDQSFDREKLESDLRSLSKLDAHIVFRGHHVVESQLQNISIPNVAVVPSSMDTNKLLGVADLLVTDYSSIFFDFLVTNRPIVHFVYDYEQYTAERGLYFGLDELPGDIAKTTDQLLEIIDYHLENPFVPTQKYKLAKEKFAYKDDGKVTERVIDWFIFDKSSVEIMEKQRNKKKILFHAGGF